MADSPKTLQTLSDSYQKLQSGPHSLPNLNVLPVYLVKRLTLSCPELQTIIDGLQKLQSQYQENQIVQKVR